MKLSIDERALRDFMSEVSEDAYCARWLIGTEYRLWHFAVNRTDNGEWGFITLSGEVRERLLALSQKVGGWIVFRDAEDTNADGGEQFVPMADWLVMYANAEKARPDVTQ